MVNQLNGVLASLASALPLSQLQTLQQQVLQLVLNQAGNLNVNTLVSQVQQLVQQVLGSNVQVPANLSAVVQKLVNALLALLPSLGKRDLNVNYQQL